MEMRRRIIGAVVAGAAGLALGLLPLTSASAHDHDGGWDRSGNSRWAHNNWNDDDDCGHGNWNDSDWGSWHNSGWHDNDWGGWR
jgi:hypothetical protein